MHHLVKGHIKILIGKKKNPLPKMLSPLSEKMTDMHWNSFKERMTELFLQTLIRLNLKKNYFM